MAEGFGLLFVALSEIFNDAEWKLPEDDAQELGDRLARWMRHGTKNVAAFERRLAKIEPMIMLIFGLLAVVVPRILHTREKRRAIRLQAKEAGSAGGGGSTEATASVPDLRIVDDDAARRNGDSASAPANNQKRRVPWHEVFGADD